MSQVAECESQKQDNGHLEVEGDYEKLLRDYECQGKELTEMRRTMDELKRENRLKGGECQDALKSLQELLNELILKSMHVGSLGNIRVFCRCGPLKPEQVTASVLVTIDFESAKDGELTVMSNGLPRKTFKFDAVFGPQANQADVFEDTASFASSILDGYKVCVFAYEQTGTRKTFTMEGTEEDRGVNFRTLEQVFRMIKEREKLFRYDVSAGNKASCNARAICSTNANEHSSRSHCIHCVMVKGENLLNGECTRNKL
ncbi:hypothetical protein OIU77_015432 [Salix suchowensis]|uniref:Kinesin motor domain-containing protein n=1 Tax=Salix suchowensis TaxID=1278906 RepID=A0ABQ8ZH10_9ROSI|nr:hypothetical protein OIU77_015432 [Salix suchowensis]